MSQPSYFNPLGQPIGFPVPAWSGATVPPRESMTGHFCRLEPFDIVPHARDLWDAFSLDTSGANWTYLADGPFANFKEFEDWAIRFQNRADLVPFAIVSQPNAKAVGIATYLRIDAAVGSIEVGNLNFSPLLQRTPAATEAMFLMMNGAFDLGFRRYEWKCNALNEPSCRAARRLGFSFEGIFRQATVVKGHNRDTAWFSIVDSEWPALKSAFEKWLSPANFEADGGQRQSLEACRGIESTMGLTG